MRALILPFTIYLGALQSALPTDGVPELLTVAAALASLTVLVYRLGVWRQEMINMKHNLGAEVARCRQETADHLARLEQRFTTFDRFIEVSTEQRVEMQRWQSRIDTTLLQVNGGER